MENYKERLQDWIFNFNLYRNQWQCSRRENYKELFNNSESKLVHRSSKIETLEEMIIKGKLK